MRRVLLLLTLITLLAASLAWAADISGTWTIRMKSPAGEDESFDFVIKQAGDNLTITCDNHPVLKTLEGTGTVKGDAVTMNVKATGEMQVALNFTGTVAGNKITGTREIAGAGGSPEGEESAESAESGEEEGARGEPPPGGAQGGERGAPPSGERAGAPPAGGAPPSGEVSNAFTAEKK